MASSNISTNARWDQWTGMTLVALVAYYVSLYTAPFVGDDASSVVAGFAVSVSGEKVHERLSSEPRSLGVILTVEAVEQLPMDRRHQCVRFCCHQGSDLSFVMSFSACCLTLHVPFPSLPPQAHYTPTSPSSSPSP